MERSREKSVEERSGEEEERGVGRKVEESGEEGSEWDGGEGSGTGMQR